MNCKHCGTEAEDTDELLNHIENNPRCEKYYQYLAEEVLRHPRRKE